MNELHIDLTTPSVFQVLTDVPTMQRWEILRRGKRPYTVAEVSEEARTSPAEAQRSLDLLVEAGLVEMRRATKRCPKITYRATVERFFLAWDSSDPAAVAAWRALRAFTLEYSRRVHDEAVLRPGAEKFAPYNFGGASSVLLLKEDASKLREAFRAVYGILAEADQRARESGDPKACIPFHVTFNLIRLWEPELPMAEFFIIEKTNIDHDRVVLQSSAESVLSPRELQIAKLLESGMSRPAVARELGLKLNTVASLSKIIYRKLGVGSRAALTARMRIG
jgi:DNA-binding CsgD family transcriptional regulator